MRTLTATLLAAQKQHITEPAAHVVIDDRHGGVFRPRWEDIAADTAPDGPSAMGMAYDGSIIRARSDPTAGTLYVQRITDAASSQQWTAWTLLASGIAGHSQIALACDGNTIQALFYVLGDGRTICLRQSTDNGQTWSAAATVTELASGHVCRWLAASLNAGSGVLTCFYGDEQDTGAHIWSTSRAESGGAWSTPQSWGRAAVATLGGLAVDGRGDAFCIVAGIGGSLCAFVVPVEELAAWPAPDELLRADRPDAAYAWPSIGLAFDQNCYIFFARSGRLYHLIAPDWQNVSIFPRPYALAAAYGACSVADSAYHYLCTSRDVLRARRWGPLASQRVDVSGDVIALRLEEYAERPGRLLLTLRNDDRRYSTLGDGAIRQGSQISVRLGYRTGAGVEVSYLRPYWVTAITHTRESRLARLPAACLVLAATDGWGLLDRARAAQGYLWSGQTVLALLTRLLAGFGFDITNDGNDAWQRPVSRFALTPGMAVGQAVRRLLAVAGGYLIFRSDATWEEHWPSAIAHLVIPTEESVYSFGEDHPIKQAEYTAAEPDCTHVVAYGEGDVAGEAVDWQAVELGNEDRVRLLVDRRLTTTEQAEARAAAELAAWQQQAHAGYIVVSPNVGQEVLDAISITDGTAGLSGAVRLVVGNTLTLDRSRGLFEQRLDVAQLPSP